jgi:hypothetical protein
VISDPLQLFQRPGADLVGVVVLLTIFVQQYFGVPRKAPPLDPGVPDTGNLRITKYDAEDVRHVNRVAGWLFTTDSLLLLVMASISYRNSWVTIACDVAAIVSIVSAAAAAWFGYQLLVERDVGYNAYLGVLCGFSANAYVLYAYEVYAIGNDVHWVNQIAHITVWLYLWATGVVYLIAGVVITVIVWRDYQFGRKLRSAFSVRKHWGLHRRHRTGGSTEQ